MTSVWKRLQRVNKKAAKFQFTASYHRIDLETTAKWKPNKLSVVWARRSRRVVSEPLDWEPSMKEPLKGNVVWAVPDNHTIAVTLFRDPRTNELEDKDWIFILEDVSKNGRRRKVAQAPINLMPFASIGPSQKCISAQLRPSTTKIVSASLEVTISSVLLREGSALDEDMQSMASMMSVNNNSDIAQMEDFDEDDSLSDNSSSLKQVFDLTHQMEMMTSSLACTPGSIPSLSSSSMLCSPQDPFSEFSNSSRENGFLPEKSSSIFNPVNFSTTQFAKKNLKPLDLKINLNDYPYSQETDITTPVVNTPKSLSNERTPVVNESNMNVLMDKKTSNKEATPAQDLLEWCKEVTKDYKQCNVTDLHTSWFDGIAFCAVINHFRSDLIDMSMISSENAENNIRLALKASDTLGVVGTFHASDLKRARGLDRLAVLTYLHQLRALFTNSQFRLGRLGPTSEETSYTIGNFNTDKDTDISMELFSQEILSIRSKKMDRGSLTNRTSLSSQDSVDSQNSQERIINRQTTPDKIISTEAQFQKEKSPVNNAIKDVKGFFTSSKSVLGKVLSPTKDKLHNLKSPFDKFMSKETPEESKPVVKEVEKKNQSEKIVPAPIPERLQLDIAVREARPVKLMTRKQLTDPFGSDEEDEDETLTVQVDLGKARSPTVENNADLNIAQSNESATSPTSPLGSLPKPNQQLLSRHDELKERARQLLNATRNEAREQAANSSITSQKSSSSNKLSEEARQQQLRERARKLIAETRAGMLSSPTSPGRGCTVEIINAAQVLAEHQQATAKATINNSSHESSPARSINSESNANSDSENNIIKRKDSLENNGNESPTKRQFNSGVRKSSSPLKTFTELLSRISPDKSSFAIQGFDEEMSLYIQNELEALEREQKSIDDQAAVLEGKLRAVMESGSEAEENALMAKWFTLVNKKNALLRRQMQLNILEQENELRRRHAKVDGELRALLGVEEWQKSEGQRGQEEKLLNELLSVVEARDQLVHHLHEHEKAIEDDDEIERNLSHVELQRKNNCSIQ